MSWRASSGIRAWMIQRLSALYLAGFIIFALISLGMHPPGTLDEWRGWVGHPMINAGLGLFFLALLMHAWVGLRDVVMDYINPWPLRLFVLMLFGLTWLGLGLWVMRILYSVTI